MDEAKPTMFCAWCRRVIARGDQGISHGICEACLPTVLAEIDARLAEPPPGGTRSGAPQPSID